MILVVVVIALKIVVRLERVLEEVAGQGRQRVNVLREIV
jgi:hypothetical protein